MQTDKQGLLNHSLFPVYQPIIDVKKQQIIGLEALMRSVHQVSPPELFAAAKELNQLLEFDRSCRATALKKFHELGECSQRRLLFLNVDVSTLDDSESIAGWIIDQVKISGLTNRQVALEIVESKVESTDKLIDFVNRHREAGFLIALDDFGESHSNLNRLVQLKPDIIKIDKALIGNIQNDYYKQSIVQAIIKLSDKIGAITLAEGVETKEELLLCYELGIQLYQGYYFSKPKQTNEFPLLACAKKMKQLLPELNEHIARKIQKEQVKNREYENISLHIIDLLGLTSCNMEESLLVIIDTHAQIDCIYLLDEHGSQIGKTFCKTQSGKAHPLFSPSQNGTDHSLKEYYYYLKYLDTNRYISEPYISLATGNVCRTVSSRLVYKGLQCVLCIDFFC